MGKLKIDYKESWVNAQKYIEQLEQENEELKMKIYGGGYEMIITKKDADIILLEKQLKELKEHHKSVCETLTNTHRSLREQLSKATEIIKEFVCHYNNKTIYVNNVKPLLEQAEQFLKEIEK